MSSMHQDDRAPLPHCLDDCKDVLALLPVSVGDHLRNLAHVWGVRPEANESEDQLRARVRLWIRHAANAEEHGW